MGEPSLIVVPQETVNDESVRILSWKAASGVRVAEGQLICEVETSKAVMEIYASSAGVLEYTAAVGDEVPVGAVLCKILSGAETARQEAAPPLPLAGSGGDGDGQPPARFSPLALKMLAEFGLERSSFPPGTLVRKVDVLRKVGKLPPEDLSPRAPQGGSRQQEAVPVSAAAVSNAPTPGVPVEWSDLPRRKMVEGRLLGLGRAATVQSSITVPCRALALRTRLSKLAQSTAGLNPLIVFETARILRQYPAFNAIHSQGRVAHYTEVNIAWAIDGGMGLVAPVIRNADKKSYGEIAAIMESHIEAYVESRLAADAFLGATFTVTDLSVDGACFFQPLISQGQSAILGIGGDPGAGDEETLYLTLAFDHQIGEGRLAVQFLRELRQRLEAQASLEVRSKDAVPDEAYCVLCQRGPGELQRMKAILVKSEVPPGLVCSLCITGC